MNTSPLKIQMLNLNAQCDGIRSVWEIISATQVGLLMEILIIILSQSFVTPLKVYLAIGVDCLGDHVSPLSLPTKVGMCIHYQ